ncbi:MAG: ATP-binding cassette domain-containing protein [Pseudomonadota bacterium]
MAEGLVLEQVEIHRGSQRLLSLDAQIAPGEVLTVMGPSGAGKSTLLSFIIGDLDREFTASGAVRLHGEDVTHLPPRARRIGILFQDDLLFPHLNVEQNLLFGLSQEVRGRANRRQRVEAALSEIGLEGFGRRDPATLSGGQKARVALLRMLLSAPSALLLDEPFSGLDAALRTQIRDLTFDYARQNALPTLLVTHDTEDAVAAGGPLFRI